MSNEQRAMNIFEMERQKFISRTMLADASDRSTYDKHRAAQQAWSDGIERGEIGAPAELFEQLVIPDTVDLEVGRNSGLREAAEYLREEARDYATRAARLRNDSSDAALQISYEYAAKSDALRKCADVLDERSQHGPQQVRALGLGGE